MKISTFLFGLLCLTPAPAVSRRLTGGVSAKKNEKDEYYDQLYGGGVEPQESESDIEPNTDTDPINGTDTEPIDDVEGTYTDTIAEQNGSMDYGYVEAGLLWKDGQYSCESITETFWVDAQESVFPMCDSKWSADSMWASYSQLCKSGVEQFTVDEMDKCFDVEECRQVGVGAAASVAGTFCKQNGLFNEEPADWIPAKCVQHAEVSCKYDAVETIQKFNKEGVCASGSALDYVDEIYQLCDQEVSKMEASAKMAGY
jgi:hypothetical protein